MNLKDIHIAWILATFLTFLSSWIQCEAAEGILKVVEDSGIQDPELDVNTEELRKTHLAREWKSKDGNFSIKAQYASLNISKMVVVLRRQNGTTIDVPISALGGADLEFIDKVKRLEEKIALQLISNATLKIESTEAALKTLITQNQDMAAKLARVQTQLSKLVPSNALANGASNAVDWKRIETFKTKYVNKGVTLLNCTNFDTSDLWISILPTVQIRSNGLITTINKNEADKYLGVTFRDAKGEYVQKGFVRLDDWGEFVLGLKKTDKVNMQAVVIELTSNNWVGLMITKMEKVPE